MPSAENIEDKEMYGRPTHPKRFSYFLAVIVLIALPIISNPTHAAVMDRTGTMWAPFIEWSLDNPSYSGNPFDLVATATFVHSASGETRTTEMFYAGGTTWKFRFAGTKTGTWTFTTASSDSELNGHSGTVTITPNPDPNIKGFLTSQGNKFARQVSESGELEAVIFNVFQSNAYQVGPLFWYDNPDANAEIDLAISEAQKHGSFILYSSSIGNRWFKLEAQKWSEHSNVDPDLRTFAAMESVISYIHSKGRHLQIWAWGDESRQWTPIGAGGINGTPDKRIQRYIAARLGPLPGWTMGYGFDLEEWVTEAQIGEWAKYLHEHFGWQHMVWGRGRSHPELDAKAYSGFGDYGYSDATIKLGSDLTRPHLYTERFFYLRRSYWDMDGTRRKHWQYTMAGGMGGWWGSPSNANPNYYPNPEQMRAHQRFWDGRFLLGMLAANALTDGYALNTLAKTQYVFYKENANSIKMDLSGMAGIQPAIAVDTKKDYVEINLGNLNTTNQTWTAPYLSDWAIAVGVFVEGGEPSTPPGTPTGEQLTITIPVP